MDIGAIGVYCSIFLALYLEVFLLITFFERRPAQKSATLPKRYPSVAILVPCWNKAATLGGTVESLLAMEYPKDKLSVIIIDDGSTDGTFAAAQTFAHNPQVKIFQKENEGSKYSALNFGITHSDSELVGCLDADSFVEKDALIEMVKKFEEDEQIYAVAPSMKVNKPRNLLEFMQATEYTFGIFYKKMFDNLAAISVLPGPFSIYRRSLFAKVGMFRKAHHTEDMEMAFRMHAHGFKIVNAHTAIVHTNVPTTVGALVRQRTRWSRGFLENSKDYSYMYLNTKFGNFGMLVLPIGLAGFLLALFVAGYMVYKIAHFLAVQLLDFFATGIPVHAPTQLTLEWYYLNTSVMTFVIVAVLGMTLVAIAIGSRIAETKLGLKSYLSYFMLFGLVAPLWLARAAYDTITNSERGWLT